MCLVSKNIYNVKMNPGHMAGESDFIFYFFLLNVVQLADSCRKIRRTHIIDVNCTSNTKPRGRFYAISFRLWTGWLSLCTIAETQNFRHVRFSNTDDKKDNLLFRILNVTVQFVSDTVRFVNVTALFLHGTVRFLQGTVGFVLKAQQHVSGSGSCFPFLHDFWNV